MTKSSVFTYVYWGESNFFPYAFFRPSRDESTVKIDIKKLIDNQYIFKEIKSELMIQFLSFYDNKWSMNNLYRTYDKLGLNFDSIYFRCLNSLIEF